MIELSDVDIVSGAFELRGLSLQVESGEYGMLMGRTGAGKSTILEAICGLRRVPRGTIRLHDVDVTRLPPAERGAGYVPQDVALFEPMTVRRHLEFAPRVRGHSREWITAKVAELADLLGLGELLERRPKGLSGGEAQRVALGRALAFEPGVLLLDEPLSALDESTRLEMHAVLRNVRERTGVTVLHITHNPADAEALATRLFVLRDGRIEPQPLPDE